MQVRWEEVDLCDCTTYQGALYSPWLVFEGKWAREARFGGGEKIRNPPKVFPICDFPPTSTLGNLYKNTPSRQVLTATALNYFKAGDGIVMFSHYFKQFCVLAQKAIKGPGLLQNRSRKRTDLTWKSFFPLLQHISAQSPDGKILYRKHCKIQN